MTPPWLTLASLSDGKHLGVARYSKSFFSQEALGHGLYYNNGKQMRIPDIVFGFGKIEFLVWNYRWKEFLSVFRF